MSLQEEAGRSCPACEACLGASLIPGGAGLCIGGSHTAASGALPWVPLLPWRPVCVPAWGTRVTLVLSNGGAGRGGLQCSWVPSPHWSLTVLSSLALSWRIPVPWVQRSGVPGTHFQQALVSAPPTSSFWAWLAFHAPCVSGASRTECP